MCTFIFLRRCVIFPQGGLSDAPPIHEEKEKQSSSTRHQVIHTWGFEGSDVRLRPARVIEESTGLCVSVEHVHLMDFYSSPRNCIAVPLDLCGKVIILPDWVSTHIGALNPEGILYL